MAFNGVKMVPMQSLRLVEKKSAILNVIGNQRLIGLWKMFHRRSIACRIFNQAVLVWQHLNHQIKSRCEDCQMKHQSKITTPNKVHCGLIGKKNIPQSSTKSGKLKLPGKTKKTNEKKELGITEKGVMVSGDTKLG